MSSRRTSSVPKEDVVFPRMLYCDSRCSQTLTGLSLRSQALCYATRPVAWATGSVLFSVRGYEVPSEPSEPSGTPGCFRRKPGLLLMYMTVLVVNHGIIKSISILTAVIRPMIKFDVDKLRDCFHQEVM